MKYKALFRVDYLHDYFATGRAGNMHFTPTTSCRKLLADIGGLFKMHLNTLYVIVPVDEAGHAFRSIPDNAFFEFYWEPADAQFFNYTQWPMEPGKRHCWHNLQLSERNGLSYLHPLPALFNAALTYPQGSFVSNPGGDCFEALINVPTGSSLSNGQHWANSGPVTYVDRTSLINVSGDFPTLPVQPAASEISETILLHYPGHPAQDIVLRQTIHTYDALASNHAVSMQGFDAGIYRIVLNGTDHIIYIDPQLQALNYPGIVRIYQHPSVPGPNRLTEADGTLLSPTFTVRMAPATAIWRYQSRTGAVKKIEDETGAHIFDQTAPRQFTSRLPIRIKQAPYPHMVLEYNNTSPPDPTKTIAIKKLPTPDISRPGAIRQNDTDYLLATTILNF